MEKLPRWSPASSAAPVHPAAPHLECSTSTHPRLPASAELAGLQSDVMPLLSPQRRPGTGSASGAPSSWCHLQISRLAVSSAARRWLRKAEPLGSRSWRSSNDKTIYACYLCLDLWDLKLFGLSCSLLRARRTVCF